MRVIKLGGSLLDMPGLAESFSRWMQQQPPMLSLLVVGGGASAEVIRHLDRTHGLGESVAHWLAIRAMQFNTKVIEALLPETSRLASLQELPSYSHDSGVKIVDPWEVLQQESSGVGVLPESWDVTSDSIAAWIATRTNASELVLLKSTLPTRGAAVQKAITEGYVDHYFEKAAKTVVHIRCVNLRERTFPEIEIEVGKRSRDS